RSIVRPCRCLGCAQEERGSVRRVEEPGNAGCRAGHPVGGGRLERDPGVGVSVTEPSIVVHVYGITDVGRTREHNEDAFMVADLDKAQPLAFPAEQVHVPGEHGALFMVADGMGGAAAGEIASSMAVDVILSEL